jgi:pyridoxine 5-phosphate synthase
MLGMLRDGGIAVSLFVDPDLEQVKQAHKLAVHGIEINTASFAESFDEASREASLDTIVDTARLAHKLGLKVSAGHGLTYHNVGRLIGRPEISGLTIGHSIVARAALVGMERAVKEMIEALRGG